MPIDPLNSYSFVVSFIPDIQVTQTIPRLFGCSKITGIEGKAEVIEIKEFSNLDTTHRFPGRISFNAVRLEKGLDLSGFLIEWWNKVSADTSGRGPGRHYKMNVRIRSQDVQGGDSGLVLELLNAWPSALRISSFDASSSGILFHSVDLIHDGFTIAQSIPR